MTDINYTPLVNYDIPKLNNDQLAKFTYQSIHAAEVMKFNPSAAVEILNSKNGSRVIGGDFGGDKGVVQLFEVENGSLKVDETFRDYKQGASGQGYTDVLRSAEAFASENDLSIGVSWGSPLDGAKPVDHAKFSVFFDELNSNYDGDFYKLAPHITKIVNDGPAGLISGAVEASKQLGATDILFPINGGGLGMAVLKDGVIYAAEPGHVEAISEINVYNRTGQCGVFGEKYVCLEMIGANKAGIEPQWTDLTGQSISAREIEDLYVEGNELGGKLYDHSAWIMAHMIVGTANAFDIDLSNSDTAIVGHGGAFKFPHYGNRVVQILAEDGIRPQLIMTKDFGHSQTNACLDGAAIAALVS